MKFRYFIILFVLFFSSSTILHSQIEPNLYHEADKERMNHWVDSVFSTMTLDQKIGQLFMIVVNPEPREITVSIISRHIREYYVGGILFARGKPEDQAFSTNKYQEVSNIPLMIALDGEWGLSMRLTNTVPFPKTMTMGAITDESLLELYGKEVGRQCKEMGIHVNFAPALDLSSNIKNQAIGVRAFGDNPERVSKLANAYARGLEGEKIISTGKHFPGHGYTDEDSHKKASLISLTRKEMEEKNLFPFRSFIKEGFSGIMTGHFSIPSLDSKTGLPSSLSPIIVTDLLKEEMSFSGLVFTDALVMSGANTKGSVCVKALLAGSDVLVSPSGIKEEFENVKKAVEERDIPIYIIENACKKVLSYKYIVGLNNYKPIETEGLLERLNTDHAYSLLECLSEESITLLKNEEDIIPLKNSDALRVASLAIGSRNVSDFQELLNPYLKGVNHNSFSISENATKAKINSLAKQLEDYDLIILSIHTSYITEYILWTEILKNKKTVLCFFIPAEQLSAFKSLINGSNTTIAAHENTKAAKEALLKVLFGEIPAKGKLPVTF